MANRAIEFDQFVHTLLSLFLRLLSSFFRFLLLIRIQSRRNAQRPLISKNFSSAKAKDSSNPDGKSGLPATTASRCAAASGSIMRQTRAAARSALYKNITAKATSKPCPCCSVRAWRRFIRRQKNRSRLSKSPSHRLFQTQICTACSRISSKRAGWTRMRFPTLPAENCSSHLRREQILLQPPLRTGTTVQQAGDRP